MANNRISTQEIAEILIKNFGKLEQIIKVMELTTTKTTEQIKAVSGSTLKVGKPDLSEMLNLAEEIKQNQNSFVNKNKELLNEVSKLKNESKTSLPNNLTYTLLVFSLLCISFVFFTFKHESVKQLKEVTKERDYYLTILHKIPKKTRDKYIK